MAEKANSTKRGQKSRHTAKGLAQGGATKVKGHVTGFTDFIAQCTAANRFTGRNRRNLHDGGLRVAVFESSVCHSAKTSAQ